MWERRRILVWGTTYPEFSKKYFETVCTGAVDGTTGRLLRIYPITLRYRQEPFGAYRWLDAELERNSSDYRPESHRIRQETIVIGEKVDTSKEWAARKELILRPENVFRSVEALREAEARNHTSLGLVKPGEILDIVARPRPNHERLEWEAQREQAVAQRELFVDADSRTKDLRYIPVRYYIRFRCEDPGCIAGHECSVLDWGTYVLNLKQYDQRGAAFAKSKTIEKLREITDPTKKDIYFFLGNTKEHSSNFMIVGFFFPPLATKNDEETHSTLRLPGF